jgi:hypothetical protein
MTKYWGPCTWYLFHTLAEKILVEKFDNIKDSFLDIIIRCCNNLPCPDCSMHAKQQLSSLNRSSIKTKDDLKLMLHSFHNIVNNRLNKPQFSTDELNNKYKLANTTNIVRHFIQIWGKPSHNPKLMTEDLHKSRVVKDFINWWNINNINFEK